MHGGQGCQIILGTTFQNGIKYVYQKTTKCTNGHKIFQMVAKYSKHIPIFSIPRPSKIYPN
jgi:hypothetical protein